MNQQSATGEKLKRGRKPGSDFGPPHRVMYSSQLDKQLIELRRKIKDFEAKVYGMKTSDPQFMDEYAKLNEMRLKEQTLESRINNLGYFPGGLEVAEILVKQPNNTNHHE